MRVRTSGLAAASPTTTGHHGWKGYLRQGALLQLVGNRYVYFPVRPITASPIAQMRLLRCLRYSLALKKVDLVYPVQHRSDLLHIPYPIA